MKRLDDNTIAITQDELDSIQWFIRTALDRAWDHHTDTYICEDSREDGMRRMNPEMYDMAEEMGAI